MRDVLGYRQRRNAQTLVFFILAFGTIILLCGLAIDSGVLYLAKARMGRAVDGAALAAVGNFHRSDIATTNRDDVATIMRNFAVANYSDLNSISSAISTPGGTEQGATTTYVYNFNDGTKDANGAYKRYVKVTLTTGAGGGITSATCDCRCPVHTYFIGFAGAYFRDLKVSQTATASRNPRLIMVVVDRSGSMLAGGGGAYGLPQSIVQFLDFFDTSSDYIGIVSFGSNARLEMPLTTNFIVAGTNVLYNTYQIDANGYGVPGGDPEQYSSNADFDPNFDNTGVRRMKFGGTTAADEGIRLGIEQLMANPGFNDPDVVKYMVLFTDGTWNNTRTLLASPGYTNTVVYNTNLFTSPYLTNITNAAGNGMTNGANPGPWNTNLLADTNLYTVPSLSQMPDVTNAIADTNVTFGALLHNHTNDVWLWADGVDEPPESPVAITASPTNVVTYPYLGKYNGTNYYTRFLDVWLQPGAVDYYYTHGTNAGTYVSDYTNPTKHVAVKLGQGDSNILVVPGYVTDGLIYDLLDLAYPTAAGSSYPRYKDNNFNEKFAWDDDKGNPASGSYATSSLERQLMFRNYPNLLTGFYVSRPDQPLSTQTEPLDDTSPATQRSRYGLGPYYPGAGFYWPFDLYGVEQYPTYVLTNATIDPDSSDGGLARHLAYSINMLSSNAAPEWAGELFYEGTGGTNSTSGTGTTSVSTLMATKAEWQNGAPSWLTTDFDNSTDMTNETAHNSQLSVSVWRPLTYNGSNDLVSGGLANCRLTDGANHTGGYVTDGAGNYYRNTMSWSQRPSYYFDFSQGTWIAIQTNHTTNVQALPLGNWKALEYAWHARAAGVTIYTVGYGQLVKPAQQVTLAQIANSTNTTAGNAQTTSPYSYTPGPGTAISYNPGQPIGQQFYATTTNDIIEDFSNVATAINISLRN